MRADPPLHRLLGGPGTSWLLHRARRRMVQGKPLAGNVTLTGATADQRRAAETRVRVSTWDYMGLTFSTEFSLAEAR